MPRSTCRRTTIEIPATRSAERSEGQSPKYGPIYWIRFLAAVCPERRSLLPIRRVCCQDRDDVIDTPRNAASEIAGLESGYERIRYDDIGQRISECTLQPVADFDTSLSIIWRDQKEDTVVLGLFTKLLSSE